MGVVPPKGLVLPFISYGSSAMMANMTAIGILLSISAERKDTPVTEGWYRTSPVQDVLIDDTQTWQELDQLAGIDFTEESTMESSQINKA